MRELPVPHAVTSATQAIEIARIWAADGAQHVSLETGFWKDPGAWGLMLVDLARHVATAYEQTGRGDRTKVLERIRTAFEAEWTFKTDEPRGGVV